MAVKKKENKNLMLLYARGKRNGPQILKVKHQHGSFYFSLDGLFQIRFTVAFEKFDTDYHYISIVDHVTHQVTPIF